MTTAAENLYKAQHLHEMEGKKWAVYNPKNKERIDLPIIYGFNNGGSSGFYSAVLLAEDGTELGGHACSHECYMENDLGILEGSREDRHEGFRKHYPDGYQMAFIIKDNVNNHKGLDAAYQKNQIKDKRKEEAKNL